MKAQEDGKALFEALIQFHGHLCGGLAFAARVCEKAAKELGAQGNDGNDLRAVIETTDACGIDAVQVFAGCTPGKGNLTILDYGKHAYTFINRRNGEAIRILRHRDFDLEKIDPVVAKLRKAIFSGEATEEERKIFDQRMEKVADFILSMPEEELFSVQRFQTEVMKKTKAFEQAECSRCKEMVALNRLNERDGERLCIPCSD
ncbi:MAG: formylmethanofuran dehydrogenase [Methanocalculus sp. MSAO_Arc2]|uniref:FmdE family protein n=1 Tax=Methanocalculus sp. MSAO_Arc2 TaxID=2293855 RepID=UPI000FF17F9E|nr:MAG: formylmethanofuran dehydrogenase [Methanocalculus sp. MSAO_Arc2]